MVSLSLISQCTINRKHKGSQTSESAKIYCLSSAYTETKASIIGGSCGCPSLHPCYVEEMSRTAIMFSPTCLPARGSSIRLQHPWFLKYSSMRAILFIFLIPTLSDCQMLLILFLYSSPIPSLLSNTTLFVFSPTETIRDPFSKYLFSRSYN